MNTELLTKAVAALEPGEETILKGCRVYRSQFFATRWVVDRSGLLTICVDLPHTIEVLERVSCI